MGEVTSKKKPDQNLTVHLVKGNITAEKIIEVSRKHLEDSPTLNVLWDFTTSDSMHITSEDISEFVQIGKNYEHLRSGGKTALVFARQVDFGMGRMLEILGSIAELKFSLKPFYAHDDALSWLDQPSLE